MIAPPGLDKRNSMIAPGSLKRNSIILPGSVKRKKKSKVSEIIYEDSSEETGLNNSLDAGPLFVTKDNSVETLNSDLNVHDTLPREHTEVN